MKSSLFSLFAFLGLLFLSSFTQTSTSNVPASGSEMPGCTLPAPASFSANSASTTSIALSWSAVSGASGYKLKVYEVADGGGLTFLTESVESGLSKTQSGLSSGKSYRFILASMCSATAASDFIITSDGHP